VERQGGAEALDLRPDSPVRLIRGIDEEMAQVIVIHTRRSEEALFRRQYDALERELRRQGTLVRKRRELKDVERGTRAVPGADAVIQANEPISQSALHDVVAAIGESLVGRVRIGANSRKRLVYVVDRYAKVLSELEVPLQHQGRDEGR
jgi:hypothetical protein